MNGMGRNNDKTELQKSAPEKSTLLLLTRKHLKK